MALSAENLCRNLIKSNSSMSLAWWRAHSLLDKRQRPTITNLIEAKTKRYRNFKLKYNNISSISFKSKKKRQKKLSGLIIYLNTRASNATFANKRSREHSLKVLKTAISIFAINASILQTILLKKQWLHNEHLLQFSHKHNRIQLPKLLLHHHLLYKQQLSLHYLVPI